MDSSKIICGAFSDALKSREENKHQKRQKFNNSFFDFIKISNHSASLCNKISTVGTILKMYKKYVHISSPTHSLSHAIKINVSDTTKSLCRSGTGTFKDGIDSSFLTYS